MRKSATILALAALGLAAWVAAGPALAIDIHGHRGARGLMPENTLPAFEVAMDLGVDILEMDTGVTRDGVVVVLHDRTLSPDLARVRGAWIEAETPVHALTHAELHEVDVGRVRPGSRAAQRFPDQLPVDGTPIPTLAEVLTVAAARGPETLRFNIETKISPLAPDETVGPQAFAAAVVADIRQTGMAHRAIVQSFDWRTLVAVKELAPEIQTAHLTAARNWLNNVQAARHGASPWLAGLDIDDFGGRDPAAIPKAIAHLGGDIWSPFHRDLTPEALAAAHAIGLEVHVWTVNDAAEMRALAEMGVDGIITDYPNIAIEEIKHGAHHD